MPSAGSSDRTRHCRANLSVVYLVCSYCRRLRDPMVQSFVMIVSFFFSSPLAVGSKTPEGPKYGNSHSRPTTACLGSHDVRVSGECQITLSLGAPESRTGSQPCHDRRWTADGLGWEAPWLQGPSTVDRETVERKKNTHTPQALVPAMRVRCHIIISKSKPRSSLVSFCGGREGGAGPKEAVPDPPPCRAQVERGIIRSATINKLHIVS